MTPIADLVRAGARYARGRGVRAAVAKAVRMYVAGRQHWYVIREDLAHPVAAGPEADGLEVRLGGPGDLDALVALGHQDRATFERWMAPGGFVFLAFRNHELVGFRAVSRRAAPWVADWFRLRADQLYGVDIFVARAHRRGGLARAIFARTSPRLHALGFTEVLGVQRLDNADSIAALARSGFTRTGRLTRHRRLWRVWFTFEPVAGADAAGRAATAASARSTRTARAPASSGTTLDAGPGAMIDVAPSIVS